MRRSLLSVGLVGATVLSTTGVGEAAQSAGSAPAAARYEAARSQPIEDPYYPAKGDPSIDALHYGLRLRWAPKARKLKGKATILFRAPVDESRLQLDLGDPLRVRSVRLDGRAVSFSHPGKNLVVNAGRVLAEDSRHTLKIRYQGTPKHVKAPTDRADVPHVGWTVTKRGEVYSMQEPFGAYSWYPVNDQPSDKAFYDARISVPKAMVGIFNGRLVAKRTTSSRTITRWHLSSPAASYLVTIAIGDYVRYRDRGPRQLPITYWVPRRDQSTLPELRRTPKMIKWLQKRLGPYPFDRIGVVIVPNFSAMETQTLVTMGGRLLSGYGHRAFRSDLLHEYAHQWYGDTVTPDNWKDLWLNEAFAMYTQFRWEVSRGWETMGQVRRYLRETDNESRASDGPPGAYHRQQFASGCVYYCGALMIDRLRAEVGVTKFNDLWRAWPQKHRNDSVNRSTYITWASARSGENLGPFLTDWLTSPTTPSG